MKSKDYKLIEAGLNEAIDKLHVFECNFPNNTPDKQAAQNAKTKAEQALAVLQHYK